MGKKSDAMHAYSIVDEVDLVESADWAGCTREERTWMVEARALARALIPYTGYVRG